MRSFLPPVFHTRISIYIFLTKRSIPSPLEASFSCNSDLVISTDQSLWGISVFVIVWSLKSHFFKKRRKESHQSKEHAPIIYDDLSTCAIIYFAGTSWRATFLLSKLTHQLASSQYQYKSHTSVQGLLETTTAEDHRQGRKIRHWMSTKL